MKPLIITIGVTVLLIVGAIGGSSTQQGEISDIISRNGIHWHPELSIYVKGEKQEIPSGIGLVGAHQPMHTHEDLPIIHLEFQGVVRAQDTTLKKFFQVWGKDIQSFGTAVAMTINGEANATLGDYMFRDG